MTALGEALRRGDREAERLLRADGARGFPEVKDWSSVKVTLSKSDCFGPCPSYSVEIRGDGEVSYAGRYGVRVMGSQKSRIATDDVRRLVARFAAADFFAMVPTGMVMLAMDAHNITLTISVDGAVAKATWFEAGQVPAQVMELEAAVDRVVNTAQWVNAR